MWTTNETLFAFYLCSIHLWLDQIECCEVFIGEHLEIHKYDKYNSEERWYNFALIEICESLELI